MTIFDTLQQRAATVLLIQHGEVVSVRSVAGGEPRDVQMLFVESDEYEFASDVEKENETLVGDCFRDESNPRGGISDPKKGDLTLLRSGETRPYAFSGTILRRSPTMLRLVWTRPNPTRFGTAHRQPSG